MVALSPHPGSFQIDATVGGGGHAGRILEAANPDGRLLGHRRGPARHRAKPHAAGRATATGSRFARRTSRPSATWRARPASTHVDGILLDLGLSSQQLDRDDRGFSFRSDDRLDMRFDTTRGVPASEVLATLDEDGAGTASSAGTARSRTRGASPAPSSANARERAHRHAGPTGRPAWPPWPGCARAPAHPSRHARLPGAAHRGQPRARGAARGARGLPRPAAAGRPSLRHQLPLPRGPHRQALHRARAHAAASARPSCPSASAAGPPRVAPVGAPAAGPERRRGRRNPRARSARLRAARRLAA